MELLCACLEGGPFHPDLTRALPLPPQRLASTVAIVAALVLLASVFVSARVRRATDLRRAETNLLVTSTDGLESLENELARARADVRALGSRLDRTASALDGGIALGRLMSATDASLRGRAELVALRAHRTDDGEHRLEIGGRVDPEPLRMVAALTAAARDLEAALGLDDVRIHPPVAVPEPGAATSVPFTLEGTLEGTLDRGLPRGGSTAPEGGR
jgi:hypothetical protein